MNKDIDINDMMVFLAVVEANSFTVAAERLGMPKANVSRKVSRLEKALGVTLLERSTRSQHLTESGKIYLIHCKRIHGEIDLAEAAVSEIVHSLKGTIKIGTTVTLGLQIIKPVIASFLDKYPDINVQLSLENQRVDLIDEGFDMLIRVGDLDDSRLIAKRLGTAQRKLYASPSYLQGQTKLGKVDELCDCHVLLMSRLGDNNKVDLVSGKKKRTLRINPRLIVDDFSIVKQAAVENQGVAILPSYMCDEEISNGELVNVLPEWGMEEIDIYALYPQHRAKIPKVKVFLDTMVEVFKERLDA